tara:strand:- start:308 stop:514 length:207 start_codon:yes stop_codon:yes gene_type:complete
VQTLALAGWQLQKRAASAQEALMLVASVQEVLVLVASVVALAAQRSMLPPLQLATRPVTLLRRRQRRL